MHIISVLNHKSFIFQNLYLGAIKVIETTSKINFYFIIIWQTYKPTHYNFLNVLWFRSLHIYLWVYRDEIQVLLQKVFFK